MEIFELTIGKIFLFIEKILELIIPQGIGLTKLSIFITSILSTILMIILWIKLEIKNQDEIDYWQALFKSKKDYSFIKNQKELFDKIKKTFHQNRVRGLIDIKNFLDSIILIFGYSENDLLEKIDKLPDEISKNKEDIKKAIKIVNAIEEKIKNNEKLELTEEEYFLIFHEYEKFLLDLEIITNEDFLVMNQ